MAMVAPRQILRILDGKPTEIMLQTFTDRVLVLVTQMGKVGNLVPTFLRRPFIQIA